MKEYPFHREMLEENSNPLMKDFDLDDNDKPKATKGPKIKMQNHQMKKTTEDKPKHKKPQKRSRCPSEGKCKKRRKRERQIHKILYVHQHVFLVLVQFIFSVMYER